MDAALTYVCLCAYLAVLGDFFASAQYLESDGFCNFNTWISLDFYGTYGWQDPKSVFFKSEIIVMIFIISYINRKSMGKPLLPPTPLIPSSQSKIRLIHININFGHTWFNHIAPYRVKKGLQVPAGIEHVPNKKIHIK